MSQIPESGFTWRKDIFKPWDKSKKYSQKAKPNDSRPLLQSTPVRHRLSVLGFHANPCYNYYILPYFVNSIKPPRLLYFLVIGMPEKAIKKSPISFLENTLHFCDLSNILNSYNAKDEFFHMFLTFVYDNRLILWTHQGIQSLTIEAWSKRTLLSLILFLWPLLF